MKFLTFAALTAVAYAGCPNSCSAHGTCSGNDVCVCYPNWTGADCSQRVCEYGRAWAVDGTDPHAYAECSGQGVCNRGSGECECFDGFTGKACSRSTCPGDCSGHGSCKLLSEIETSVPYADTNWDANRIQTCVCDPGYFGPDCSQRRCPTGDDPLTLCNSEQYNQVQEVRFVLGSKVKGDLSDVDFLLPAYTDADEQMALFAPTGAYTSGEPLPSEATKGQLRINYVDAWGGVWTAHGVSNVIGANLNAKEGAAVDSMETALETLPNKRVNDVVVASKVVPIKNADGSNNVNAVDAAATSPYSVFQRVYQVKFLGDKTNSNNVGLQNTLICDSAYSCTEAGCQPTVEMPFLYRYGSTAEIDNADDSNLPSPGVYPHFYTGDRDSAFNWAAKTHIRLNPKSSPQLPVGVAVDTGASKVGETVFKRYDGRVLIAVRDASTTNGIDDKVDRYYTKVILGHTNIDSDDETFGGLKGAWVHAHTFQPNLDGFSHQGLIPVASYDEDGVAIPVAGVPVPGAPGVFIDFPSANLATDNKMRLFEILFKLPHCSVTPVVSGNEVRDELNGAFGDFVKPVDPNVENIECAGRGQCDRKTGTCKCFEGYYGISCNRQTTLV